MKFLLTKLCIYVLVFFASALNLSSQNIDSLERILAEKEGVDRIDILQLMSRNTWLNYPQQSLVYSEEARRISEEIGDSARISQSLRHIGAVYYYSGNYELSMKYNGDALAIAESIGDSALINNGYNNIGLLNYNLGNYQAALEFFMRSLEMKYKINESYGLPTVVNNIGLVYEGVADYETARRYFAEAYDIAVELNDISRVIYTQNNLGITYLKENDLDLARNYFEKGLALSNEVNNIVYGAVSNRGIGQVLFLHGDYDSARVYYQRSLEACETINERRGVSETQHLLAELANASDDIEGAIAYLNSSTEIAEDLKLRKQLLDNLELYATIHKKSFNSGNEIKFLRQYINLRDSLYQDVVGYNLALVPVKIKEEGDRRKMAQQQAELIRQSGMNRVYTIAVLIAIPLIILLVILLRNNRKANKVLQESNEELKSTQKLLVTSEKMASLGVLTAGIGHEINNPLNFIKNGSAALTTLLNEKYNGSEEFKPFLDAIQEGVNRASSVVKSMSQFSRVGMDLNESCSVHDIIDNCLVILNNKISLKAEVIKDFTNGPARVLGNEGKLHQAFLNILSNAEQAIEKKGTITITTQTKGERLMVSFLDTGVGIPDEHLIKISDPFFTTKAPGEGLGLGLFITHSIIEEHGGNIHISSDQRGTEFKIELPLSKDV